MKNNLYENFEERELRKIQAECDRYGYHAFSMRYISVQKEKNGILYQQTFMGE